MPYEDKNRMAEFYTKAFGWESHMMGPEMGDYVVMTTSEQDPVTKMPKKPGMINGGFFARTKDSQSPSVVIAVDDINEAMKKVTESGGKVLGGRTAGIPDDIPGVGLYASFIDSEGNRAGMLQPKGMGGM